MHFEGRAVTWAEFDQRTDAIAAGLAGLGVCGGERLGILGNNSVSWCELVVAACKTGAVVVPLNIRLSPDELAYITAHAGCAAVAVDADLAERYDRVAAGPGAPVRIRMEGAPGEGPTVEDLAASRPHPSPVEAGEDDVAVIAYTSGTTGRPKGVMLEGGPRFRATSWPTSN